MQSRQGVLRPGDVFDVRDGGGRDLRRVGVGVWTERDEEQSGLEKRYGRRKEAKYIRCVGKEVGPLFSFPLRI